MQTLAKRRCWGYNAAVPKCAEATQLIAAAAELRDAVNRLSFAPPVEYVYNPLDYAWAAHEQFLSRYGGGAKRTLFLGMNPGPFGMAQVGVPFGEVAAVRDWLRIGAPIGKPIQRSHTVKDQAPIEMVAFMLPDTCMKIL